MLKVGEIVVCINDSLPDSKTFSKFDMWPRKGNEYTIRRNEPSLHNNRRVLVEELRNSVIFVPEIGGKIEPGYAEYRFKRKKDLTIDDLVAIENSELKEITV